MGQALLRVVRKIRDLRDSDSVVEVTLNDYFEIYEALRKHPSVQQNGGVPFSAYIGRPNVLVLGHPVVLGGLQ